MEGITDNETVGPNPSDSHSVGSGPYVVQEGDCFSSIAARFGHSWETLWNHPANEEVKRVRQNPNVLKAGDLLTIPEVTPKHELCKTGGLHVFTRAGLVTHLRLILKREGMPLANVPFTLTIGARVKSGQTKDNGLVETTIPAMAEAGLLVVGEDPDTAITYRLGFGRLDPISSISGVQQRLTNLGFDSGPADGILGPRTRAAIESFQDSAALPVTGTLDRITRDRLAKEHES